jgi:hypothetical protein
MGSTKQPDDAIIAAYAALMARWQAHSSMLWQILGFVLAGDIALAIGYSQAKAGSTAQFLIGTVGMGGVGIVAPLAARWVETHLRIDRVLLDRYERHLLIGHSPLRLRHTEQQRRRLRSVRSTGSKSDESLLDKRRLTHLGILGERIDRTFDLLGQPSLIWSGVVMGVGVAGSTDAFMTWTSTRTWSLWELILSIVVSDSLIAFAAIVSLSSTFTKARSTANYWRAFYDNTP